MYPGYEKYYLAIDKLLQSKPTRIVLVAPGKLEIGINEFKEACKKGAPDPSKVGVIFITSSEAKDISLSLSSFASHLENYANVPVLLILATDHSISVLKNEYAIEESKNIEEKEAANAK